MHEYLEFSSGVCLQSTLEFIQNYFAFLDEMNSERSRSFAEYCEDSVEATISVLADGKPLSIGSEEFLTNMQNASKIIIDCKVVGNLRVIHTKVTDQKIIDCYNEDEIWQGRGMSDHLESIKRKENFVYKAWFFYPDDDNRTMFDYIVHGKSKDVTDLCDNSIISKHIENKWYGRIRSLYIGFDDEEYPEILERLHASVRKSIPEDQLRFVEELWDDEEEDSHYILSDYDFFEPDLLKLQSFLDEVNDIIAPLADSCEVFINDGNLDPSIPDIEHCFFVKEDFALASIVWRDNKFQIIGALL